MIDRFYCANYKYIFTSSCASALTSSFLSFLFEKSTKKHTNKLSSSNMVLTNKEKQNTATTFVNVAINRVSIKVL